jgi:hypothetical protein
MTDDPHRRRRERGAMCLFAFLIAAILLWSDAPGDELYRWAAIGLGMLGVIVSVLVSW